MKPTFILHNLHLQLLQGKRPIRGNISEEIFLNTGTIELSLNIAPDEDELNLINYKP